MGEKRMVENEKLVREIIKVVNQIGKISQRKKVKILEETIRKERERKKREIRKEMEIEIIRRKEEKEAKEEKEEKEAKEKKNLVVKTACRNRHITDYGALIYQWNRFWSSVLRTRSKIKSEHFVVVLYISFLK